MRILILLLPILCMATTYITENGELSIESETYILSNDISVAGTAFIITADNIIFDLNEHSITYNTSNQGSSVYGIYIGVGIDKITIKDGYITQGDGADNDSPAIFVYGASFNVGPHQFYNLIIDTQGETCHGISATATYAFDNGIIHDCFFKYSGSHDARDNADEYDAAVNLAGDNPGGIYVYNCVIANFHMGVGLHFVGMSTETPTRSYVYNNNIQHKRVEGQKSAYGINLGRCSNVACYDNQICSEDGRGITMDGYSEGVQQGTIDTRVEDNYIDVQYTTTATEGYYVENNIYGIRNRYVCYDDTIRDNVVFVDNANDNYCWGMYLGDADLDGILVDSNTVVVLDPDDDVRDSYVVGFYVSSCTGINIENNEYLMKSGCNHVDSTDITPAYLIYNNNTVLDTTSDTPDTPTGLAMKKFNDDYYLTWTRNSDEDDYFYNIYRDGSKIDSLRGVSFFIDTDVYGSHSYTISALTISERESAQSSSISTSEASIGWWGETGGGQEQASQKKTDCVSVTEDSN